MPAARATSYRHFWWTTQPHTYIGWGRPTQLGYGLGLAMGAKLAMPDKLCINVWGDAAIGFTGMDFETAVARAHPHHVGPAQQFLDGDRAAHHEGLDREVTLDRHLRGDYAAMARACRRLRRAHHQDRGHRAAIKRGHRTDDEKGGVPVLLEFITSKEVTISVPK